MKNLQILVLILLISKYSSSQNLLVGASYKRIFPASDSSKAIYKSGGGIEGTLGLNLKHRLSAVLTGTIDVFNINRKTNSATKENWIGLMLGVRKDITLKNKSDEDAKNGTRFFICANYGFTVLGKNRYSERFGKTTNGVALLNIGLGINLKGIEAGYVFQSYQDKVRGGWIPMHQLKLGFLIAKDVK